MTTPLPSAHDSGLHVRYEKAGLILDALPIPWNADAVLVEANVRLSTSLLKQKQLFTLQFSTGEPGVVAESLSQESKEGPARIFFRIAVPPSSRKAQIFCREQPFGQVELPIVSFADFVQGLSLQMPTLHVGLGSSTVACQTFVNTQSHSLAASALLSAAGPLAPVADLNLRVELLRNEERIVEVPIAFASGQLRTRQALLTVLLPKARRAGEYSVVWWLGPRRLHTQKARAIAKKRFLSSLRISATRFVVQSEKGDVSVVRWLPQRDGKLALEGIARVGPCFFVCSSEAGMAGLASFAVEVQAEGKEASPPASKHEMVVTDGPMPLLLGTLEAAELSRIKHFELSSGDRSLGVLPLLPAPTAQFNSEGGFSPLGEFLWSAAADEALDDRLGKLLGE